MDAGLFVQHRGLNNLQQLLFECSAFDLRDVVFFGLKALNNVQHVQAPARTRKFKGSFQTWDGSFHGLVIAEIVYCSI